MATSGVCDSWKAESMESGHCFNAVLAQSGTTHTNNIIDGMATTAGIAVGMGVTGTNVAANTTVVGITSATAVTVYPATTGSATNTMTFTGDTFNILLIKTTPGRTFDHTQTNVGTPGTGSPTTANVGTDEVTGTGYTTGGVALTNISPSLTAGVATVSFSPNPSWTSATFSTTAAIIYNTSTRLGAAAAPFSGRTVGVYDFGGTQTVSSGTLTLVMPTNDNVNAILRIG
jgi:hypothetical protein